MSAPSRVVLVPNRTSGRAHPGRVKSCYERQRRYREKQRLYVERLEETVQRLRAEVNQQLAKCHAGNVGLVDMMMAPHSPFKPFARTVTPSVVDVVQLMRRSVEAFVTGSQEQQSSFLESAMRSDAQYGDLGGRDNVVEQWLRFAASFAGTAARLENAAFTVDFLERDVAMGHVNAVLVAQLTHVCLANVFPHVLAGTRLYCKMLNSVVHLPMTVTFHFDGNGNISRFDPAMEMATGLHKLLENYQEVLSAMERVNINAYGHVAAHDTDSGFHPRYRLQRCGHRSTDVQDERLSVAFLLNRSEALGDDTSGQATS